MLSIANAYMGAIQGQLFDTGELRRRARQAGSDQFRALNALIQGDVSQVSQGFITTQFSQADLEVLRAPLPDSKLLQAPDIVRKAALFPQREGANFVAEVYGSQDSWVGVDAAYADPPVSTEQILHPEKYIAGEKPRNSPAPDVSSKMGKGWTQVSNDTMGEFILKTYLEQHLTEAEAATAAAGMGRRRLLASQRPRGATYPFIHYPMGHDGRQQRVFRRLPGVRRCQDARRERRLFPAGRQRPQMGHRRGDNLRGPDRAGHCAYHRRRRDSRGPGSRPAVRDAGGFHSLAGSQSRQRFGVNTPAPRRVAVGCRGGFLTSLTRPSCSRRGAGS